MAFHRLSLFAAAAAPPLSLAACSSSSGGGGNGMPEGMHYHYVANQLLVPTSTAQAHEYGLDLDGNGTVDNQLGQVLSTLGGMGFDIQGTVDKAVLDGSVIFLADVQTKDFTNASNAGFQVFLGQNPMPAACNAGEMPTCDMANPPACTGCGHHLSGTGSFTIDPNGPQDAALTGKFAGGTFTAGPGSLTLPLTLAGANLQLSLIGARIKASGVTATQIGSGTGATTMDGAILAGALTQDDLNTQVIPAIQQALGPLIVRDCCGAGNTAHPTCDPNASPSCYCTSNSTGATILGLFDNSPKDCMVSVDEIKNNQLIQSLLAPDVTINGKMALSLGVKMTAVGATYTQP
jgi:hypothetical protein